MKTLQLLLTLALLIWLKESLAAQANDFGDAPDPGYPTVMASGGPMHLVGNLFLGARVDMDMNGQPNMLAMGDDFSMIYDDEDGVVFQGWLIPGQNQTLHITTSLGGVLNAWIDWNKNMSWADPGEQIFTSQTLGAGLNTLTFSVPASAAPGTKTYARFRYSSLPVLGIGGPAPDGEVEDYQVYIGSPQATDPVMDPDPGLSFSQNEVSMTYLASSSTILAAYNDNPYPGGQGIGISYSNDQGLTWTALQLPIPISPISGVTLQDAFDPTITCDDSGHVFTAHIATDYNWTLGPESGLFVHKSVDGGMTWQNPVIVSMDSNGNGMMNPAYRFNDRCQITSDRHSGSPYHNAIYLTWIKDRGWNMPVPSSDIYFSYSHDGGRTFSSAQQVNSTGNNLGNMPIPTVAADGDVYLLWYHYNVSTGGNAVLFLDHSTDAGASWGNDVVVDTIQLPPLNLNSGMDARAKGAGILRAHPTDANRLYIVYAEDIDLTDSDEADIFFIRSTDGGQSWSTPLQVNDDTSFSDQFLPWMEVSSNDIIDIVWYDRRNDPMDLMWDVYACSSSDGGLSFNANHKVNISSYTTPQTSVGSWMGEYLGLTLTDTFAYVGFTSAYIDQLGDVVFGKYTHPGLATVEETADVETGTFIMYPNPALDKLHIESKDAKGGILEIFDISGRLILRKAITEDTMEIDLSGMAAGVYGVRLSGTGFSSCKTLLRNQ